MSINVANGSCRNCRDGFLRRKRPIEAGVEEMFVQRFMDAIGGRLTVERDSEQLLHNFYIVWLDKVTKLLDLTPAKTGSGGKQLFDAVGNMLGKAGRMLKERYKPEK